ncbi:LCP family protein [Nonomuraea sp. NPDC059194]|uniref:LCP family protein n=1 Tax=Nonomuraea sp. NPDC059194 TaxID=3346764 RepID=UPI0036BC102D
MTEDDRTRAMRSPGDARPLPRPQGGPMRSGGAPAHQVPGAEPTRVNAPPSAAEPPRSSSRVYGKARSGNSPVRPLGKPPKEPRAPRTPGGPRLGGRIKGGTILKILAGVVAVLLVLSVVGFFWINGRIKSVEGVLDDYEGRPADTPGTNWLLVGSDSREGLSAADRKKLATGRAVGRRTDSMMLLHIPDGSDRPTLVSLPRDSAVSIPGQGRNKLNAAFAIGGPQLLTRTVENVTGIRIDNYMEVGFAGFVDIVDAVGGVEICVKNAINDPKAGLKLKKGCQEMDGGTALGYVRTRKGGALPDFERTKRQRQFLSAVVKKAASPGVLINPFTSIPLAMGATDAVRVDGSTGAFDLLSLGLAMGGDPVTTVVPFGGNESVAGGDAVKWDRAAATQLFDALKEDRPVPKDVLDKS